MVNLAKRRVDVDAGRKGVWFEAIPEWPGIAVKATAIDTDACIRHRQEILEEMFGDPEYPLDEPWLRQYVTAKLLLDGPREGRAKGGSEGLGIVKDIRGLTNDAGKDIPYTRDYLAAILLKDQKLGEKDDKGETKPEAKTRTPDGKLFDPAAKAIYDMLLGRGIAAGKVREETEKKPSPAGSAGGAVKASTSAMSADKAEKETAPAASADPAKKKS
jgi:hypothetical protein